MAFYAEYQPPAEYESECMDEVEARWALLKIKRWEQVAGKYEELLNRPDAASEEISRRIWNMRRRYRDNIGVEPDERADLRKWLVGFIPLDRRSNLDER